MKIHEYQAKDLLKKYGIKVPKNGAAETVEEALEVAKNLKTKVWVVKAQIHAGGRGKGGGVKIAKSLDEVKKYASEILGMKLVTHQTDSSGKIVKKILIEEGLNIKKELYLGMVVDRATSKLVFIASTEGGMEIEEVAKKHPDKIIKEYKSLLPFLPSFKARKIAFNLGFDKDLVKKAAPFLTGIYSAFIESDCSLLEINPLVITEENDIIALDAKINFDDNALFRHKEFESLRDLNEEDPKETEASKFGLSYISLDGNIGCLVNGAGLAMSTMDIIKLYGGEPANFLDVGGSASQEAVTKAFEIILQDPKVKGILVNIFGGIMKCDVIATGVIEAAKKIGINVPLVVRLEGTNVEIGQKMLAESGLNIIPAIGMKEAAQKVVEAIK